MKRKDLSPEELKAHLKEYNKNWRRKNRDKVEVYNLAKRKTRVNGQLDEYTPIGKLNIKYHSASGFLSLPDSPIQTISKEEAIQIVKAIEGTLYYKTDCTEAVNAIGRIIESDVEQYFYQFLPKTKYTLLNEKY